MSQADTGNTYMMHTSNRLVEKLLALILIGLASVAASAAEEEAHHKHHVAAGGGMTWHHDHNSAYLGFDYVYRFDSNFAVGAFYEEVSGDFDLRAYGLIFGKYFANGWKVGVGPGVENKITHDKTLLLFHVSTGFDWHHGNWTFGPTATIDFIEDSSSSYYLGFSVGRGF